MQVKCKCGKLLNVPDSSVGKNARCPACKAVFPVVGPAGGAPAAPAAAAPGKVLVTCSCGKRLSAPAGMAGKKIACPGCARELIVPGAAAPAAAAPSAPSAAAKPAPAKPAAPPAPKPAPPAVAAAPAPKPAEEEFELALDDLQEETPKPAPAAKAPEPEPEPESDKAEYVISGPKCPSCQETLDPGAQFCVHCGTHLATGGKLAAAKVEESAKKKKLDKKTALIGGGIVAGVLAIGGLTYLLVGVFGKKKTADSAPAVRTVERPADKPADRPADKAAAPVSDAASAPTTTVAAPPK